MRGSALALGLLAAVGCTNHRSLETRVGSRRTESYQAEAEHVDGQWRVSLALPAGEWSVHPEEDQPFEIVPGSPRSTLIWRVQPDRWSRQDRPFGFLLRGPGGQEIHMSVAYPHVLGKVSRFVLMVLGQSRARFQS